MQRYNWLRTKSPFERFRKSRTTGPAVLRVQLANSACGPAFSNLPTRPGKGRTRPQVVGPGVVFKIKNYYPMRDECVVQSDCTHPRGDMQATVNFVNWKRCKVLCINVAWACNFQRFIADFQNFTLKIRCTNFSP